MADEKDTVEMVPGGPLYVNGPYYTWSLEGPQPPQKVRREDDVNEPDYPVIRVHSSHTPGLTKQARLVRPITKPDVDFPLWIVKIGGREIVVHHPEEAWTGG